MRHLDQQRRRRHDVEDVRAAHDEARGQELGGRGAQGLSGGAGEDAHVSGEDGGAAAALLGEPGGGGEGGDAA